MRHRNTNTVLTPESPNDEGPHLFNLSTQKYHSSSELWEVLDHSCFPALAPAGLLWSTQPLPSRLCSPPPSYEKLAVRSNNSLAPLVISAGAPAPQDKTVVLWLGSEREEFRRYRY